MAMTPSNLRRSVCGSSRSRLHGQNGQSMVEVLVILPVMLGLIFGAIQFGLIYHAKITLNYAAYEAVRAGTLNCDKKYADYNNKCTSEVGQFAAVKEGFARGLAPLYSYFEPIADKRREMKDPATDQVEAYQRARAKIFAELEADADYIRIERLSPTDESFTDFAVDQVIPNDNLIYRSITPGKLSQESIQDANLLHLRVIYWYPLYVPIVGQLMFNRFICCKNEDNSSCRWAADPVCRGDEPRIPLTATAAMRMQVPVENSHEYYAGPGDR